MTSGVANVVGLLAHILRKWMEPQRIQLQPSAFVYPTGWARLGSSLEAVAHLPSAPSWALMVVSGSQQKLEKGVLHQIRII